MTLIAYWDFAETDATEPVADSATEDGAQDGIYQGTAKTSDGKLVLDGKGYVEIPADDAFQLSKGTLKIEFNQNKHIGSSPDTLVSRDSLGRDDGGHFNMTVTKDGRVEVRHQTDSKDFWYKTDKSFFKEGDDVRVTYSWDQGTGGTFTVENLTTGITHSEPTSPQLTMDMGSDFNEPWTIGAGQTRSSDNTADNLREFFDGEIAYVAIYDTVVPAGPVTLEKDGIVSGTSGDDIIDADYTGDPQGDMIDDGHGTGPDGQGDFVAAGAGDDVVFAGEGDDIVFGGDGDDTIYGGPGDDILYGDGPNKFAVKDLIVNGSFEDTTGLSSTGYGYVGTGEIPGWTTLDPNREIDIHNDSRGGVDPTDGNNWLDLDASPGNIRIGQNVAGVLPEVTYTLSFAAGASHAGNGFKLYWGGELLEVDGNTETFPPLGSMQTYTLTVTGGAGDGSNRLEFQGVGPENNFGASIDSVSLTGITPIEEGVAGGNDTIYGGDGNDTIYGGPGDDTLFGGDGDDVIFGGDGDDVIFGGAGDDTLFGGDGDDVIFGGEGDDTIFGGAGDDILYGDGPCKDGPTNFFPEWPQDISNVVFYFDLNGDGELDYSVKIDEFPDSSDATWISNDLDDFYAGLVDYIIATDPNVDSGPDVLGVSIKGGVQPTQFFAVKGDENGPLPDVGPTMNTGPGNDATYDYGDFHAQYDPSLYTFTAGAGGDDVIFGGDGNDVISGGGGDDELYGGAGDDFIVGGPGQDQLFGEDGNDLLIADGTCADDYKITITFEGSEAGFKNTLGFYQIDPETGRIFNTQFAFENASPQGEGGDLIPGESTYTFYAQPGAQIGSFIIADGFSLNDFSALGEGSLRFVNGDGDPASVTDAAPTIVHVAPDGTETPVNGLIWHSAAFGSNIGLNADGKVHTEGLSDNGDGSWTIGFEDLNNLGDQDFNDVIFTIDLGTSGASFVNAHFDATSVGPESDPDALGSLLDGGAGDDVLVGGAGDDILIAGSGNNVLYGGAGNDTFIAGSGDNIYHGGDDRDTFIFDPTITGNHLVFGGDGGDDFDTLDLSSIGADNWRFVGTPTVDSDGNGFDGQIEILDADGNVQGTITFENIENIVPCFTPGSLIATARGEVPVETLRVGDKVITRDNGLQEICWFGRKDLTHDLLARAPHLRPVLIRKGSLGRGLPERDMLVSPNHRVLVANERTNLYFGEKEVLVAAKHLVGANAPISVVPEASAYIHFMFERHEVVLSDGAWTESFQPGDYTLRGIDKAQRAEIIELFPELGTSDGRKRFVSARPQLKRHEAALLR
ncbi:MAG: Hint domain-containing protein [Rhodobacteraceae bacterium]|nr:Hint domain-containing protein [Paracoccaceae bacterium]